MLGIKPEWAACNKDPHHNTPAPQFGVHTSTLSATPHTHLVPDEGPQQVVVPEGVVSIGVPHVLLAPAHLLPLFAFFCLLLGQSPSTLLLWCLKGFQQLLLLLPLLPKPLPLSKALLLAQCCCLSWALGTTAGSRAGRR